MHSKRFYREQVKRALRALPTAEFNRRSARLVHKLLTEPAFLRAKTVMAYLPLKDEVDISPIFQVRKKFFVPVHPIFNSAQPSPQNILHPQLDLIIVPGRAFTQQGVRIGRGAGYYDRFLSSLSNRVFTIALAFSFQIFAELPFAQHDVKIHKVISEE